MRFPILPALILLVFDALIDIALYKAIVRLLGKSIYSKIQAISAIVINLLLVALICMPKRNGSDAGLLVVMWSLFAYLTIYVPKIIFLIFYLLARLPRIWKQPTWRPVAIIGAVVSVVVFLVMWWGALINRTNIQVREVAIPVADLPDAFDGFTIAQISDLHVGTFGNDTAFVAKLVDKINSLNPDVIVFTGDIVNRRSREAEPFVKPLSRLHAKYGVYSVLGNHDYGDYADWPTPADKLADVAHIKHLEGEMGWHLLNNEHDWIHIGGDSIAMLGVENIGDPPFTVYGDFKKSYPDLDDSNTKILLSHNPMHWQAEVRNQQNVNVALTLSGHTHAMQMELFGLSPAALRYHLWGGLYEGPYNHYLYVNIGAGTVGMPYRIGATPEITLLTLKKAP